MKNLTSREIRLLIFLFITLVFSLNVHAATLPEWIPPEITVTTVYRLNGEFPGDYGNLADAASAFCSKKRDALQLLYPVQGTVNINSCPIFNQTVNSTNYYSSTWTLTNNYGVTSDITVNGSQFDISTISEQLEQCLDPLYSIPVDSTGDGQIDQCHKPSCEAGLFVNVNSNGSGCATMPDGSFCGTQSTVSETGNLNPFSAMTGETCTCDPNVDCLIPPIGVPDGPDCTTYSNDGGSTTWCTADPAQKCDSNGICEDNCGYVNNDFVCVDHTAPPTGEPDPNAPEVAPDTSPCLAGDSRPECVGVPEGGTPNQDGNVASAMARNNNQNTQMIAKLDAINKTLKDAEAQRKADEAADNLANTTASNAEQSQASTNSDTTDSDVKNSLTNLANHSSNPEAANAISNLESTTSNDSFYTNFYSTIVPIPSAACGPYTVTMLGESINIVNCQAAGYIRMIFGWIFYMALVGRALFIIRSSTNG